MSAMGKPLPAELVNTKRRVRSILRARSFGTVDSASVTTGKDYLLKIWALAVSCPVGIAIVHEGIRPETMANVFYELGWMHAYGRETVVIKIGDVKLPSDLIRTEYISIDASFNRSLEDFLTSLNERAEYYQTLAGLLEANPLLAIDYLRRAYLLTGARALRQRARRIFASSELHGRALNSVERLMVTF
ncbi:MAG TPA: hypothetical protein VGC66_20635 [Pyrinomonadaceae bacterium]